jgi:glycerol-3-phosphate dehydrogenase (NAD(P)+)
VKHFNCIAAAGLVPAINAFTLCPHFERAVPGTQPGGNRFRQNMALNHIAVLGGGAWGTALALTCARAGRSVTLWEHDAANADRLKKLRESAFLPGIALDERIVVAGDLAEAARAEAILSVVPAQAVRAVMQALAPALAQHTPVIVCAKGIERGSKKFMTEVIAECAPKASPAILSGPSFAADVARGMPTAVTLAAADGALAGALAQAVGSATFRPYHSSDVRGVEIGGAAKNVLAIAAGVVTGRELGASALAALTTRGFAELVRFGKAYGAKPETLMGLSGLGDLLLTCSSPQSRNFTFGIKLGRGEPPDSIHAGLAEGVFTAPVLLEMARDRAIDMPISAAVADLLSGKMTVEAAIGSLLTRPFRAEA